MDKSLETLNLLARIEARIEALEAQLAEIRHTKYMDYWTRYAQRKAQEERDFVRDFQIRIL